MYKLWYVQYDGKAWGIRGSRVNLRKTQASPSAAVHFLCADIHIGYRCLQCASAMCEGSLTPGKSKRANKKCGGDPVSSWYSRSARSAHRDECGGFKSSCFFNDF